MYVCINNGKLGPGSTWTMNYEPHVFHLRPYIGALLTVRQKLHKDQ